MGGAVASRYETPINPIVKPRVIRAYARVVLGKNIDDNFVSLVMPIYPSP